ncbi:MAG: sialate O-acetylesterase [Opitutus sp.]
MLLTPFTLRVRRCGFSPLIAAVTLLVLAGGLIRDLRGEVQVASPFGDHMVLQCETTIPVWGTAEPGETVTVEFGSQKKHAVANDGGAWRVNLEPVAASLQPHVLLIGGSSTAHPRRIEDVLVGEVWLCAGELNMARQLGPQEGRKPITHWEQEAAEARHPLIRQLFITPGTARTPQSTARASWTVCLPETVTGFSAVAYFFARDLQAKLGVPIGIINSSRSETPVEAWTSTAGLSAAADVSTAPPAATAAGSEGADTSTADGGSRHSDPSLAYNAMIAPLIPYAMRGVAFYQVESNSAQPTHYRELFTALIADWRTQWAQGDFPFLFVQVAPYREARPELREAQLLTWQHTKNTAMVVTLDCGDIDDPVPARKQPVGTRLALAARAIAYHEKIEYSGPVYESMSVDGEKAVLHFSHLTTGLAANDFSLMGFTMAGPDGIFHAAHGEIEGETVTVSIPDVTKPAAVRYAWERAPDGNLVNDQGLPASPFRTDRD